MMERKLFVFDENVLISAALIRNPVNAQALDRAFLIGTVCISHATLLEFTEVLYRPKFDKYLNEERRVSMINRIEQDGKKFRIKQTIRTCRDPKDDKYLELAVAACASCIITGDNDLLVLNPLRDIPILTATGFINQF
ncbi:putative toxin-antitoxin system toxin component, PIN family [Parapedobacter sp.]